ncbi:hypothetical protein PIB30_053259 [Stylosanthes scabra]|uniref:Indole-3-acetic acid-amido synthetase GH3.1 n=1 Tax=Stylosanthes scabra TaxID=79078 RepID=A0ABU6ZH60_9FABA|nr:hypothetical protein [Stylosanthes scabra]
MAVDSALSSPLGPPACEKDAKALQFIEEMTRNADAVQERVLAEILSRNAETEYLKRFKLGGATDRQTFKSKVPVITYEDVQPEIQRIANGDRSAILSTHPISEFLTSSGTSAGERKLMPTIKEELDRRQLLYSLLMPVMNLYYKSDHFKTRPYDPYNVYTSPNEAILCPDSFQSMYTQMVCGLIQRSQVLRLGAVFASGLLRAIRFLQLNWAELAQDIRSGSLNSRVSDPEIRDCMGRVMKSDPELAQFVEQECSKENWDGIITRIWPNTKYLDVIVTGAMAQYIPTLNYYSGGLPLACTMYASSECYFGLNLNPMCKSSEVSYTIMPNMAYFEFLPHESNRVSSVQPKLVDLVDVEVGKEYELVITTYAGLNRYRVGDILRVTGFHNSAPQFHFVRRKNVLLSIDSDKTDESELQRAVENASKLLSVFKTSVVEYTSYADTKTIPGHYVIYWELLTKDDSANSPCHEVLNRCCLEMEESLNSVYRQCRVADHSIGPLEIRVVKSGTFEELMDYAISRGASINQYKVPRCVNFTPIMELLDSRVVSVHFSQGLPHWSPQRRR